MQQTNCLNFCEILPYLLKKGPLKEIIIESKKEAQFETYERVYIGTSFCGKYFLQQSDQTLIDLLNCCKEDKIKLTLVIPTFSEGDLESAKKKIQQIIQIGTEQIDEITVNDFGMLSYIKEEYDQAINIGRLFMKDYRDPRYEDYFQIPWKPKMFTNYFQTLLKDYKIKCCEFDLTHKKMDFSTIPEEIIPGLHVPYCYQTVGRICEYASIPKDISNKFRANDMCQQECTKNMIEYYVEDGNIEYIRYGRTVYFKHPGYKLEGLDRYRLIYFPIELQKENERKERGTL